MAPAISAAIGVLGSIVKEWWSTRNRIKEAKVQATVDAIKTRQRTVGFMDDFLLYLHAGPIIGVFFPQTRPYVLDGLEGLEMLPDWYLVVWFTMVAGVWGVPKLIDTAVPKIKKKFDGGNE
jgi:hypothetical protein